MGIGGEFTADFKEKKLIRFHMLKPKVRLHASTEPYIIRKSKEDGEKDLESIVRKSSREGCWAYAHEHSVWYNIAAKYIEGKYTIGVVSYTLDYSEIGTKLTHYHTHQKIGEKVIFSQIVKETMHCDAEEVGEGQKREIYIQHRNLIAIAMAVPSYMDIESYYGATQRNPPCKIKFKIASPYGITSVRLLDKSLDPRKIAEDYSEAYIQTMSYGQMGVYTGMKKREAIASAMESLNVCFENVIGISLKPYKK